MFRKRSFFLAGIMTALVLTGCGGANTASEHATDTLLVDKLEGLESADFKTVVAQKGDLTKSVEDIRASLYFGEPQYLTYSVENVVLNSAGMVTVTIVEFYGNAGSSFNAGEPILKINRRVDEIARIEAENELGSLRETYAAACADYEQKLSEEDVTSAAYHSLKKEYDSYMSGMEETLKRMEAELAFCDEAASEPERVLAASCDCVLSETFSFPQADGYGGLALCSITPTGQGCYRCSDDTGVFAPGRRVTLKDRESGAEFTGVVIYNRLVAEGRRSADKPVSILIDGVYDYRGFPETLFVSTQVTLCEDAVLIPDACVHSGDGRQYVYVKRGDLREKVYFHAVYKNNGYSATYDGVQAGDELIYD